ncbi:MAG: hypothetical protein HQ564_06190 [Candidatus Saganbacteria bacterium]|nr:hypothetical protein [Candidatus Saganbacteria bacterium]
MGNICFSYTGLKISKSGVISYKRSLRYTGKCPDPKTAKEFRAEFALTRNKNMNSPEYKYFKAYAKSKGYRINLTAFNKKGNVTDIMLQHDSKTPLNDTAKKLKSTIQQKAQPQSSTENDEPTEYEERLAERAMDTDYFCQHQYYKITHPKIKSPQECREKIHYSAIKRALSIYMPKPPKNL